MLRSFLSPGGANAYEKLIAEFAARAKAGESRLMGLINVGPAWVATPAVELGSSCDSPRLVSSGRAPKTEDMILFHEECISVGFKEDGHGVSEDAGFHASD